MTDSPLDRSPLPPRLQRLAEAGRLPVAKLPRHCVLRSRRNPWFRIDWTGALTAPPHPFADFKRRWVTPMPWSWEPETSVVTVNPEP